MYVLNNIKIKKRVASCHQTLKKGKLEGKIAQLLMMTFAYYFNCYLLYICNSFLLFCTYEKYPLFLQRVILFWIFDFVTLNIITRKEHRHEVYDMDWVKDGLKCLIPIFIGGEISRKKTLRVNS
jgi:hypothetical protein